MTKRKCTGANCPMGSNDLHDEAEIKLPLEEREQ